MIKITHYEVYTDNGSGWQLEERFSSDQRQEAFNLAKEHEIEKLKVKIIKEVFDVQDNSYQESVEYVSNLNRGVRSGNSSSYPNLKKGDQEGQASISVTDTRHPRDSITGALLKLVIVIILCLAFANFLVSLLFPVLNNFIPEENSKPVLFVVFFVLFLAMAVPLVLKIIPWYVFAYSKSMPARRVPEKKFFDRAEQLVRLYNLGDEGDPVMTPAYPEAPLEYKQYMISFLSELLSNIQSHTVLTGGFSKLGVKLLVYGGTLEMARYSGLRLPEANSVLYEAFRITDGANADLEAFYEAKRSYRDNKIAIFLTGVGSYLMSHVIEGRPMPTELLNVTFRKWEDQNKSGEPQPVTEEEPSGAEDIYKTVLVSIKSDLKFLDQAIPNQEEVAAQTSAEIRNIIFNLLSKYNGTDTIEADGITSVRFRKLNNGIKFATECLKDIGTYQEETNNDNLILRNCCAITEYQAEEEPNLSGFLNDMFEHIYNNEIVVTEPVEEALAAKDYHFDFLGEKKFSHLESAVALYKLID